MRALVILAFLAAVGSAQAALFGVFLDVQVWVSTPRVPNQFDYSNRAGLQFDHHEAQNNATADAVTNHGAIVGGIHDTIFNTGEAHPGPITDSRADANSADGREFDLINFTPATVIPITLSFEYSWDIKLSTDVNEGAYGGFSFLLAGQQVDSQSFQIGSFDSSVTSGSGAGSFVVMMPANSLTTPFMNVVTSGWATAPPATAAAPEPSSLLGLCVPLALALRRRKSRAR